MLGWSKKEEGKGEGMWRGKNRDDEIRGGGKEEVEIVVRKNEEDIEMKEIRRGERGGGRKEIDSGMEDRVWIKESEKEGKYIIGKDGRGRKGWEIEEDWKLEGEDWNEGVGWIVDGEKVGRKEGKEEIGMDEVMIEEIELIGRVEIKNIIYEIEEGIEVGGEEKRRKDEERMGKRKMDEMRSRGVDWEKIEDGIGWERKR